MRIQHRYLTHDSDTTIIHLIKTILDKHSATYTYKEDLDCVIPSFKYSLEFFLHEDDPNFSELKSVADTFELLHQVGTIYEKSDVDNADWFIINTGEYQYPQPEANFGYLQATFNLENYCKLCGIGKIQNAPYRLKSEPKQPNKQFWGLHWAFDAVFVREEAKHILEHENIKGIRFSNPVLHKANTEIESFYQLHIDTMLEEGFDNHNTKTITCKIDNEENCNTDKNLICCGRIKFHHPMIGGYTFEKSIFNPDFDIIQTQEYFGSGRNARRLQIVSKRIKHVIEKHKLKGISFIPVIHERLNR